MQYDETFFLSESLIQCILLPDLDDEGNPIAISEEERIEAISLAIPGNLEYCSNCSAWTVPNSHICKRS